MDFLFRLVTITVLMAVGMVAGYISGTFFDYFMGTHATPLFTLAGLIGIGVVAPAEGSPNVVLLKNLLLFAVWPFIALLGAFVASVLFPATTQSFMDMLGYSGSIYMLAFWGSVTYGIAKAVMTFIFAIIAEFLLP